MAAPTETGWGGDAGITGDARAPGAPTFISNGDTQINIVPIDENDNGPNCDYAIQLEVDDAVPGNSYLPASGEGDNLQASGVFRTAAAWTSVLAVTNLSGTSHYRFRAYSRNESDQPANGTVGAWSAVMIPNLNLAWSTWGNDDSYDITSGNTQASSVTLSGAQRTTKVTYTLTNKDDTASSIDAKFNKDEGAFATATQVTIQAAGGARIAINIAGKTLTSLDDDGLFFKLVGQAGEKIFLANAEDGANDGSYTISTVTSKIITLTTAPGANNTDDEAVTIKGGDDIDSLATSEAGTSHTFLWDTGTDLGNSYKGNKVGFEITPYDTTSQGGSADTAVIASGATLGTFTVNNVPNAPTLFSEIRGVSWDKDTTPEFIAEMSDIIVGDELYFAISFTNDDATPVEVIYESDGDITGWWYEQDRDDSPGNITPGNTTNWTAMTVDGVDKQYITPIYQGQEGTTTRNRVRFILPGGSALTAGKTYTVKIKQGEIRNVA